mgnify:CR=1 FL=1
MAATNDNLTPFLQGIFDQLAIWAVIEAPSW